MVCGAGAAAWARDVVPIAPATGGVVPAAAAAAALRMVRRRMGSPLRGGALLAGAEGEALDDPAAEPDVEQEHREDEDEHAGEQRTVIGPAVLLLGQEAKQRKRQRLFARALD